jgi:hypothetical protein
MSISELIEQARLRLVYLSSLRASAAALGDTAQVDRIDAQSAETQTTLNKLLQIA